MGSPLLLREFKALVTMVIANSLQSTFHVDLYVSLKRLAKRIPSFFHIYLEKSIKNATNMTNIDPHIFMKVPPSPPRSTHIINNIMNTP